MNDSEPPQWRYFRHVLTFYSQLREWNESINNTPLSCRTLQYHYHFHTHTHPFPMRLSPDTQTPLLPARTLIGPLPCILHDISQKHVHSTNIILTHSRAAKVAKGHLGFVHTVGAIL